MSKHSSIDPKRKIELEELFSEATVGIVLVTAFLDRPALIKFLGGIAWETEVWVADAPAHLIHFNGERFLGPYPE